MKKLLILFLLLFGVYKNLGNFQDQSKSNDNPPSTGRSSSVKGSSVSSVPDVSSIVPEPTQDDTATANVPTAPIESHTFSISMDSTNKPAASDLSTSNSGLDEPSFDFTDGISNLEEATANLIEGTPNPGPIKFRSALVEPTFCPSKANPSSVHSTSDTNQDSSIITSSVLTASTVISEPTRFQIKATDNTALVGIVTSVISLDSSITATSSALSKTNSGSDESNSVFTERGFHPEYFTSGQIQINSDSNKFASDPGKDSTSSDKPTSDQIIAFSASSIIESAIGLPKEVRKPTSLTYFEQGASSARGASFVIPEPTQFETETTGNTVLDGIATSAMSLDSSSTAVFIFDEGFSISSPNYPNNYNRYTISEWILKPINPESPITIRFNDFNTNEYKRYYNLNDYVTISEKDKEYRRFYGNLTSPFNVSGHGYMIVWFQPYRYSRTQRGFQATVYNGEQVFILDEGMNITSPNYPENYQNNMISEWILKPVKPKLPITIQFNEFNTERCCDIVQVNL